MRSPEKELAGGGLSFKTPAFDAAAANITPDRETGIGTWSDAEIKAALTEGSRPAHARLGGVPLAVAMTAQFYKAILPRDLDAIVAYLHSLPAVRNQIPVPIYKLPVHREPYPDAEAGFTEQDMANTVRRGAYLVTIGHCMACHAAFNKGVPDFKGGLGRGGRLFSPAADQGFPADWPGAKAANITSHHTPWRESAHGQMRKSSAHYERNLTRWTQAATADGLCLVCRDESA